MEVSRGCRIGFLITGLGEWVVRPTGRDRTGRVGRVFFILNGTIRDGIGKNSAHAVAIEKKKARDSRVTGLVRSMAI